MESGFEGQQDYPAVRGGMCKGAHDLNSRGRQTELGIDHQSGARHAVPLDDVSLPWPAGRWVLGTGCSCLQGTPTIYTQLLHLGHTGRTVCRQLWLRQGSSKALPDTDRDPVALRHTD